MTITERILAAHCGKKEVHPGKYIEADVDLCLANDLTGPLAIREFKRLRLKKVFNPDKIVLVPDHFTPAKDIKSANLVNILRQFSKEQKITHFYEVGKAGIEHALLPEQGLIRPGDLIIGADSHTCTYGALGAFSTGVGSTDLAAGMATGRCWFKVPATIKFIYYGKLQKWVGGKDIILYTLGQIGVNGANYLSMEFSGEVISSLPIDDRFSLCNMAVEAGAKNGIIEPDRITRKYLIERSPVTSHQSPVKKEGIKDEEYLEIKEYNLSKLQPLVACPYLPSKVKPVEECKGIFLDQVVIGSCTNGRISDFRVAASILKGKRIFRDLRLIVIPATPSIYRQALKEGLMEIFVDSGAIISPPTCGPCLGGHMGVLGAGEVCLSTTNRNFRGRMGDLKSKVYLSNPAVAAASAVKGRITHPNSIKD